MKVCMKIVEKYLVTGNKPFSVFTIYPENLLLAGGGREEQERRFFYYGFNYWDSETSTYGYLDIFNSGERMLDIMVNSKEEFQDLFSKFKERGFKVRKNETTLNDCVVERLWFQDDIPYEPSYGAGLITLYLRKRELPRFLDFLKELSKKHGYKTFYYLPSSSIGYLFDSKDQWKFIVK